MHDYSFLCSFSEIEYRCVYIYFDNNKNTFKYDVNVDNLICKFLSEKEETSPSHRHDVFLYDSLIHALSNLVRYNIIQIPLEFQKSFDAIKKK